MPLVHGQISNLIILSFILLLACGVTGNTTDFDSVISGSIPDTPATYTALAQRISALRYERKG